MVSVVSPLDTIQSDCIQELSTASSLQDVERIHVVYLGRKGKVTLLLREIGDMSLEEKRKNAPRVQELRRLLQEAYEKKRSFLQNCANVHQERVPRIDVTAYRAPRMHGGLHPYTHMITRIEDIFTHMGWSLVSGPEVEDTFHNFEALNIPELHPARDVHDTFWLTLPNCLLRTHTSSVQIRALKRMSPPLAICAPGRTFRHEATDATHDMTFMQCEGLFIDHSVKLTDLLGVLTIFMQQLFDSQKLKVRVLPDYFPFVEPGLTVLVSCFFCTKGCSICKHTCWIEVGGAGMVHPYVLKTCSLDPQVWQGFAFGFGIERIAMLMFGITDIRLFKTNKLSVLQQFSLSLSG